MNKLWIAVSLAVKQCKGSPENDRKTLRYRTVEYNVEGRVLGDPIVITGSYNFCKGNYL
jgi:hypothetical protein